jgi:hypothetical protein
MKEKIEKYLEDKDILTKEMKLWVVDKTVPLDERWNLFLESQLGDDKSYIERFDCKVGDNMVDDMENKYAKFDIKTSWDYGVFDDYEYSEEEMIEYKENVLKSFIKSFQNDW